jgi:hypothetical protein
MRIKGRRKKSFQELRRGNEVLGMIVLMVRGNQIKIIEPSILFTSIVANRAKCTEFFLQCGDILCVSENILN